MGREMHNRVTTLPVTRKSFNTCNLFFKLSSVDQPQSRKPVSGNQQILAFSHLKTHEKGNISCLNK